MNPRVKQIFRSEFRFGIGGVPIGSEFQVVTDDAAQRTMEASWEAGVRYYDVSPWYGLGEAERRFGRFLHNQPRDSYVLSTKVGKLLKACHATTAKRPFRSVNPRIT